MFKIISALSFEVLEQHLLDHIMQPGADPFLADQVLIPSAAIQRRLTFSIADHFGICSRVEFSFVATWLWQQTVKLLSDFPERSPFDANTLRWRIFKRFDDSEFLSDYPRLRAYLEQADATMRFDLASQVAALFDQYTTFRPDWLEAWSMGRVIATPVDATDARADEIWQAALWRGLLQDITQQFEVSPEHPSQLFLKAYAEAVRVGGLSEEWKQPVHVFCVPSLPPLYLKWLRGLAEYRDVVLYVLDPCQEYWHDLIPARELARNQVMGKSDYQEVGHRLLASWGRQTQAYVQLLMSQEGDLDVQFPDWNQNQKSSRHTLLEAVQKGIQHLQDLTPGLLQDRVRSDGSIQIHVCHSLTRELEVLQDCLLARFKEPDPPRPSDILVVVPDLDQAAPLIEGVFGHAPKDCYIPYMISGVAPITVSPCAQSILTILKLARSRLTLLEVIETLRLPLIAEAVGIPLDEVDTLSGWLKDANVRWSFNAEHRAELGLPSTSRHSFEEGLDRLFLGYALPEDFQGLWQGQLAVESVEGMEAHYLGAFAIFLEHLHTLHLRLQKSLTAAEWSRVVEDVIQSFINPHSDRVQELQAILQGLVAQANEMADAMAEDTALPVDVLMRAFEESLQGRAKGGMPTGALTFAAMPSLRGVPYRFVCILGLNDQVFPSPNKQLEFDLIARSPRLGDRQRHHDERNLFLDLMLSARERLHLSYVGKDRRDNTLLPPSVVLAEFLDALVPALCEPHAHKDQREKIRRMLITEHPLQAFSEAYFDQNKPSSSLFSFRKIYARALQERHQVAQLEAVKEEKNILFNPRLKVTESEGESEETSQLEQEFDRLAFGACAPFFNTVPQEPLEAEWRSVRLEQFIQFIQNPVQFYLTQRLGITLPWLERGWPDTEDFQPTKGAARNLAQRLIPSLLASPPSADALMEIALAGREFPEGLGGQEALASTTAQIQDYAIRVQSRIRAYPQSERSFMLNFHLGAIGAEEVWTLEGELDSLFGNTQVHFDFVGLSEKKLLELWCRHLCLCVSASDGEKWSTEWMGSDGTWVFTPMSIKEAQSSLQDLLELYSQGLQAPLHFFPQSAFSYVQAESENSGTGLKAAMKVWMPSRFNPYAEGARIEYRCAFRGKPSPLDDMFENLATRIFRPVLNNMQWVPLESSSTQPGNGLR